MREMPAEHSASALGFWVTSEADQRFLPQGLSCFGTSSRSEPALVRRNGGQRGGEVMAGHSLLGGLQHSQLHDARLRGGFAVPAGAGFVRLGRGISGSGFVAGALTMLLSMTP
jgi:hypothetical protein